MRARLALWECARDLGHAPSVSESTPGCTGPMSGGAAAGGQAATVPSVASSDRSPGQSRPPDWRTMHARRSPPRTAAFEPPVTASATSRSSRDCGKSQPGSATLRILPNTCSRARPCTRRAAHSAAHGLAVVPDDPASLRALGQRAGRRRNSPPQTEETMATERHGRASARG
jgi:hypothetical protein